MVVGPRTCGGPSAFGVSSGRERSQHTIARCARSGGAAIAIPNAPFRRLSGILTPCSFFFEEGAAVEAKEIGTTALLVSVASIYLGRFPIAASAFWGGTSIEVRLWIPAPGRWLFEDFDKGIRMRLRSKVIRRHAAAFSSRKMSNHMLRSLGLARLLNLRRVMGAKARSAGHFAVF